MPARRSLVDRPGFWVALFFGVAAIAFVAFIGLIKAREELITRLDAALTRLNENPALEIDITPPRVGLTSVEIDRVDINRPVRAHFETVRVSIGINPFGGNFLRVAELSIDDADVRVPIPLPSTLRDALRLAADWADATNLLGQPAKKSPSAQSSASANPSASFGRTLDRVLGRNLRVMLGEGRLHDGRQTPVRYSKVAILARRVDRFYSLNAQRLTLWSIEESGLRSSAQLPTPSLATTGVSLAGGAESGDTAWSLRATLKPLPGGGAVAARGTGIPATLRRLSGNLFPDSDELQYNVTVGVARANRIEYSFDVDGDIRGLRLRHAVLGSQAVGPLPALLNASGTYRPYQKAFLLETAKITLPKPDGARPDATSPEIRIAARSLALNPGGNDIIPNDGVWDFSVHLPPTPCQSVLDVAPRNLLTAIEGFALSGTTSFTAGARVPLASPENFTFQLSEGRFDCRVERAPAEYSRTRLMNPFVLERFDRLGANVRIPVDPRSPDYTAVNSISRAALGALVSAEDAGFFAHHGIDTEGVFASMRRNLAESRVVAGGSTITMQTVKNLFLGPERTVARKLQEMFLAHYLESVLTKQRILELYVNIAELGPGIYGIGKAARRYFGKGPSSLTPVEGAFLATLLPAPVLRYHQQFCRGDVTPNYRQYMNDILRRMNNFGYITDGEYQIALTSTPRFNLEALRSDPTCRGRMERHNARSASQQDIQDAPPTDESSSTDD